MTEISDIIDNQIRELDYMYQVLFQDCIAQMEMVKKNQGDQVGVGLLLGVLSRGWKVLSFK